MTDDDTYRSRVRIVREGSGDRRAEMPAGEQVHFGVHGEIAEHYGADMSDRTPLSATLDYLVAATAGWLTGTFGRALEVRGIDAGSGRLSATAVGEVEKESHVLVLKRVQVTYHLTVDDDADLDAVDRVLRLHADACPMYRSIHPQIQVTTDLELL